MHSRNRLIGKIVHRHKVSYVSCVLVTYCEKHVWHVEKEDAEKETMP